MLAAWSVRCRGFTTSSGVWRISMWLAQLSLIPVSLKRFSSPEMRETSARCPTGTPPFISLYRRRLMLPAPMRDLIDMTDATAQAALKKAIAIDAAADQLMDASDQLAAELAVAAPGTAPMIEAQSAAMLVKAHALRGIVGPGS